MMSHFGNICKTEKRLYFEWTIICGGVITNSSEALLLKSNYELTNIRYEAEYRSQTSLFIAKSKADDIIDIAIATRNSDYNIFNQIRCVRDESFITF